MSYSVLQDRLRRILNISDARYACCLRLGNWNHGQANERKQGNAHSPDEWGNRCKVFHGFIKSTAE